MDSPFALSKEEAMSLFSEKQSTLQEMASFKFAVTLWTDVMNSGNYHHPKFDLDAALYSTAPAVIKIIKHLHVPRLIKDQLLNSIMNMKLDQTLWMVYHYDNMLARRRVYLYPSQFKYCVWKCHLDQHGRIDYRESARKMVAMGQFDKRASFEILCKFCLLNELKSIPLDAEFRKYTSKLNFQQHPLAFYWKCYLTDEMYKIPIPILLLGHHCLEEYMLTSTIDVDNWPCMEYFFDRLTSEVQIDCASKLLANPNSCWYLKQLYWKLNEDQWCEVFQLVPVDVIMTFFRQFNDPASAEFLWMKVKDSFDGELYSKLMQRVLKEKDGREFTFQLAIKFWNTADDELKTYLTTFHTDLISKYFLTSDFVLEHDQKLEFLFDLLTYVSIPARRDMILEFGDRLVVIEDFSKLDLIIDLCLPNADEVAKFKNLVAESTVVGEYSTKLFSTGRFDFLDEFFKAFFPDESTIIEHKKRILETEKTCVAFIFEPKTWSTFEKFVEVDSDVYAASMKKKFVLGFELISFNDRKNTDQLDHLEVVVAQFLTIEESAQLKQSLLDSLYKKLYNFVKSYADDKKTFFEADFLTKLVFWCCSGDEKVSEFKQRLSLDEIFAKSVAMLMRSIRYEDINEDDHDLRENLIYVDSINVQILVALDEFLEWYLVTTDRAKEYKLKKMFDFGDEEFFRDLAATAEMDKQDAKTVLTWLLGNDQEQICKFKSECGNETITNMI